VAPNSSGKATIAAQPQLLEGGRRNKVVAQVQHDCKLDQFVADVVKPARCDGWLSKGGLSKEEQGHFRG